MSRGKSILLICYTLLFVLIVCWCCDYSADYAMTEKYGYQFAPDEKMLCNQEIKDIDYYLVTEYDGDEAQVYYVDSDGCKGELVCFEREGFRWRTSTTCGICWKSPGAFSELTGLYWCLGNEFFR